MPIMNEDCGQNRILKKAPKIIIAGGGTGGHLFPGIAIAEEFLSRNDASKIMFIGSERGIEKKIIPQRGFPISYIDIEGIKGRGVMKLIGGSMKIPGSLLQSRTIINEFNPALVIGVGGYASGPAVITAWAMGIRTAIQEQNAVPGLTNRILGHFANGIFLAFEETAAFFSKEKIVVTGNPVRKGFSPKVKKRNAEKAVSVLVFGGSQGASSINKNVLESLEHLEDIRGRMNIVHQTGEREHQKIQEAYRARGFMAEVVSFIDDMAGAFEKADLLVCRAGATTIAEITAAGKASILIPYPHAVGRHQELNAQVLANAGAAEMILENGLSGETLANRVRYFVNNTEMIGNMEEKASNMGNMNAASDVVDECINMMEN